MADAKKLLGHWHVGPTGDAKTRKALQAKGYRVIGQNFTHFGATDIRPFDVVVAEEGVDVDVLKAAYGKDKVLTADEAIKAPAAKPAEVKKQEPFNPDDPPAPRKTKKQG